MKTKPQRTLVWNVENRLHNVRSPDNAVNEAYLYDETGQRLKRWDTGYSVFYPFAHYEDSLVNGTRTSTKYYFFGGQRVAMKKGSTLKYLHGDHLGGTVLETTGSSVAADQKYWAYGNQRDSGPVSTSRRFTGQVYDGSGLYYMNARYYDPALGMFVSPDTVVPEPGRVIGYNRYAYAYGNPLKYSDPTGHAGFCDGFCIEPILGGGGGALIAMAINLSAQAGPGIAQAAPIVTQFGPQLPALADPNVGWVQANGQNAAQQGQQADSGGNTAGPGGLDPNNFRDMLPHGFSNQAEFQEFGSSLHRGLQEAGYDDVQAAFQGSSVTGTKYTTGQPFDVGRVSDFDIALGSPQLLQRANDLGISLRSGGIRTGPLRAADLTRLGLDGLARQLSEQAGRPVNFMIFDSLETAANRAPSIIVP